MSRKTRGSVWLRFALPVLALLVVVGAASASGSHRTAKGPEIRIGFVNDLTGAFAANGANEAKGFNLGLKDFGGSKFNLHLKYFDSGTDPTVALSQARAAVEQFHAQVIEGPISAAEIGAVASYVDPLGIPIDDVSFCSAPQVELYQKYSNAMTSGWACDTPVLKGAEWAYKVKGWKHMTMMASDYAFGWTTVGAFEKVYKSLGGTIDKEIWIPLNATDYSAYTTQVPKDTQAVYATFAGAGAVRFTDSYAAFGLHGKIPVLGVTTVHDWSVIPAENPNNILGDFTTAQYCDGIVSKLNNLFTKRYHDAYGAYPGYYSEDGYVRARVLLNALRRTNGNVTDTKKFSAAMRSININAPRGPVTLDKKYWAPIQNVYICKVQKDKNGDVRNVPIFTYKKVPLHGSLSESEWVAHFLHDAAGRP